MHVYCLYIRICLVFFSHYEYIQNTIMTLDSAGVLFSLSIKKKRPTELYCSYRLACSAHFNYENSLKKTEFLNVVKSQANALTIECRGFSFFLFDHPYSFIFFSKTCKELEDTALSEMNIC